MSDAPHTDPQADDEPTAAGSKYAHLPERVRPEDYVEEQASEAPHDPDGGRNPENDFLLRYTT